MSTARRVLKHTTILVVGPGNQIRPGATLAHGVLLGEGSTVCSDPYLENITIGRETMCGREVLCLGYGRGQIEIGSHSYISFGPVAVAQSSAGDVE